MNPSSLTQKGLRWLFFWIGFGALFGALDGWRATKHDGTSVSELLRSIFHTDTTGGKVAFTATLVLLFFIFLWHIAG